MLDCASGFLTMGELFSLLGLPVNSRDRKSRVLNVDKDNDTVMDTDLFRSCSKPNK